MYNLLLYIFQFGVIVAAQFFAKVRTMLRGQGIAVRYLQRHVDPNAEYVWFHAASLGEFEQGRPIMEEYRRVYPNRKILLTFFSPSGYEVRKHYDGADLVCYLPIDTVSNARKFLRTVRPVEAFFIKYEFWYNYLHILRHRGVPVYSVSSVFRPDQVFFQWYGRQYRHVLKCFTHFFVQNEESRELLASIGINNVDVTGDTRFDRVAAIAKQSRQIPVVETFLSKNHKCFIAGSSWLPDERIFTRYFREHPGWKMIIAPHVIAPLHLEQIKNLMPDLKVKFYTQLTAADHQSLIDADVLVIDCFGLLSSMYKYGQIAYVGGGFGVGIHNLPEAAVWNMPVIFGPNNAKFIEAQELKECGGGLEIENYDDFCRIMDNFQASPESLKKAADAAGNYVRSQSGATEKLLTRLRKRAQKK